MMMMVVMINVIMRRRMFDVLGNGCNDSRQLNILLSGDP